MAQPKRKSPQELGLVPVDPDEEEEERRPVQQAPSPPKGRTADPRALGLIPLEDEPANDDLSPQALGLVPADTPQPDAPDEEGFFDWAWHKGEQFLDTLRSAAGLDPAPEPANADMEVIAEQPERAKPGDVPEGKITAPGTVADFLIPDFLERPVRSIYDFASSDRTQQSLEAGTYAAGGGLMDLSKNAVMLLNYVNDFLTEETGIGVKSADAELPFSNMTWGELQADLAKAEQAYAERYAQTRVAEDQRGVVDALVEALPQIPVMVAEYGAAGATMGPILGFAAIDALMHADEGAEGAAWAGAKGAALGAFFEWANILSRPLRIPALAAAGGGMAAAEGGSDADIAAQSILFPVLGMPQRSGPVGVRYLREHGVAADLRDMGGHIRDLLVGGNVQRSKADAETAGGALAALRQKHNNERQQEQARFVVEQSQAKEMKPGETNADVVARVEKSKRDHEENVNAMNRRHMNEEQPLRHAYEMAERRHQRALHPFRTSWQTAPYMRALHSAEQKVLVVHHEGYTQLQSAYRAADERFERAKEEAKAVRARVAKTPEEAQRNREYADYLESEGGRLAYEMRTRTETEIESRIQRAEALADRRRFELAQAIGRGNKVEGRRAMWLAADHSRQAAYRSGIRLIRQGENRARRLIELGDNHVRMTERALRERGLSPDDAATKAEYDARMSKANQVREDYREMASLELLDAQYRADSRVSRAELTFGQAVEAARIAGVPDQALRRQVEAARRKRDENTKPDDAKKPSEEDKWDLPDDDGSRTGIEFEHAYRRALEGTRDDPVLGEIAKRVDPILERIQDPTDVLPAIARIAKELGHDPKSRRGRQSEEKRKILAERLGMTEDEFIKSPYGKAFSDYEIEAAIMLLDRQYSRLRQSYNEFKRNPGSSIARQRVHLELVRFLMIRNRLMGAAAEAGRSLRMFRELKKQYGSLSEPLSDRDIDRIMTYDKPGAVARIAQKTLKGDWFGAVVEYWINGLLSSFQTAFVNIYSGIGMLAYKPIQTSVAATIGLTRWAVWNIIGRPLTAPFRGLYRLLARQGVFGIHEQHRAMARRSEALGASGNPRYPREFPSMERIRFGEVGARVRGYIEALTEFGSNNAVFAFFRSLFTGEKFLGETSFGGPTKQIPWWLGGPIIRFPGRILQAIDDFVKAMSYRAGLRAHAYRQAVAESQNLDVSSPAKFLAARREMRRRYQELVKNPTASILHEARNEALEATFQQDVAPGFKWVSTLRREVPASAFVIPFHKVLLNTLEWMVKGTPLAVLYKQARMDLGGFNGRARQDMAIAHMATVMGSAFIIYMWALNGNVRGPFSSDPKKRAIQGISGTPPLGVRIPGTEQWVSVNRVDPLGGIVALGAAAAEVTKTGKAAGDEEAGQRAWSLLVQSIFSMSLSRAGLSGLVDFIEAIQGGSYGTDIDSLDHFMQKLGATLAVPQFSAVLARTQDPYLRYAHTTMEEIMARLPGQRSSLYPVRNMWGDPIKGFDSYGEGPIGDLLDLTQPFYWGVLSKDPASVVMMELHEIYRWAPGALLRQIGGRRLTDDEYDFYAQRAGRIAYEKTRAIAASAEYAEVQRLQAQIRQITKQLSSSKETSQAAYLALEKQREALREELRKKRYALLNKVKSAHRAARKQARLETAGTSDGKVKGRFNDIWKRPKLRDPSKASGELPEWAENLSAFMEAEDENEDWDAEQREDAANDNEWEQWLNDPARQRLN